MNFEQVGLLAVLAVVFIVLPWWLIGNAIERRDQRRASAAEEAAHAERIEHIEELGQELIDRFGPLTAGELGVLWNLILSHLAVNGGIQLFEVERYVAAARRFRQLAAAEAKATAIPADPRGQ